LFLINNRDSRFKMSNFLDEQGRTKAYDEAYLSYVEEVSLRRTPLIGKRAILRRKSPAEGEVIMNRIGRFAPGAHGQNNRGRTGDDVAAGPDALFIGFAGFLIRLDITPLV